MSVPIGASIRPFGNATTEVRENLGIYPCLVDVKYDGELGRLEYENGKCRIYNKGGNIRCMGASDEVEKWALHRGIRSMSMLGEITHDNGKAGELYNLLGNKASYHQVFRPFELMHFDGMNIALNHMSLSMHASNRENLIWVLDKIWVDNGHVQSRPRYIEIVDSYLAEDAVQLSSRIGAVQLYAYEGVIIRPLSLTLARTYKYKFTQTWDMRVASIDPSLERVEVWMPNMSDVCGVKVSHADKVGMKVGDIIEIKFLQQLQHGLRNPIFVRKRPDKTEASYV